MAIIGLLSRANVNNSIKATVIVIVFNEIPNESENNSQFSEINYEESS